jgi:hypothetical protein
VDSSSGGNFGNIVSIQGRLPCTFHVTIAIDTGNAWNVGCPVPNIVCTRARSAHSTKSQYFPRTLPANPFLGGRTCFSYLFTRGGNTGRVSPDFILIPFAYIDGLPLWSSGQRSWLLTQRSRVRFPLLPDFLSSSGSGTGSTRPL